MKRIFVCFVLAAVTAAIALAADVTGKWVGSFVPEGSDSHPALLILTQNGTAITGTAGPDESQQFPIGTGKIEGNKVSVELSPAEGSLYKLDMVLDGDHLKGDLTVKREDQTMTAKIDVARVK